MTNNRPSYEDLMADIQSGKVTEVTVEGPYTYYRKVSGLPTYDQLLSDIRSDKYDDSWFTDRLWLKEKVIEDLTPEAYTFAAEVVAKLAHSRWTDYTYARKLWQVARSNSDMAMLTGTQREILVEVLSRTILMEKTR